MHFDRLDEIYAMVKSILHFENIDQTSLNRLGKEVWPVYFDLPFFSVNTGLGRYQALG